MISKTTDAKPLLDKIERAKIERDAAREFGKQELAQKIACSKGLHPDVVRGRCPYCNRRVQS